MATLRDFLNECKSYQYSSEYYNLMKESAEIVLMEHFVENQNFVKANNDTFTEGYLMESVSDEQIQQITESIKEKSAKLGATIKNSIAKIVNGFKAFIATLIKRRDNYKVSDGLVKKATTYKYNAEFINSLANILVVNDKFSNPIVEAEVNVPENGFATVDGYELSEDSVKKIVYALKMLQNKVIVKGVENALALETILADIRPLMNILKKGEEVNDAVIEETKQKVEKELKTAQGKGIVVDFSLKNLDEMYKELESYGDISKIDAVLGEVSMQNYAKAVADIMPVVQETISMYNSLLLLRLKIKKLYESAK